VDDASTVTIGSHDAGTFVQGLTIEERKRKNARPTVRIKDQSRGGLNEWFSSGGISLGENGGIRRSPLQHCGYKGGYG